MRVKIYQIDLQRDHRRVAFLSLSDTYETNGRNSIDSSIYDEVFDADLDPTDLESLFTRFNTEKHPLFRGRSMSVSDVVVIDQIANCEDDENLSPGSGIAEPDEFPSSPESISTKESEPVAENGSFYCDALGFKRISFDESQTHKPDNLLKVVYVEPNRKPFEAEILPDLEHLQLAVGGLIEPIYMDDGTIIVGNDESKLLGMEGNRHLGRAILAGPFFICGESDEDFRSLTKEETERYMELFAEPEHISSEEVQEDMGYMFFSMT